MTQKLKKLIGISFIASNIIVVFFYLLACLVPFLNAGKHWFIALLGLANSLMWPAIFPLAIDGLGKFTKIGSALLVMAIAGGAILPLLYGKLSESFNSQQAYWIMVPCYLFILYFAAKGHRVGKSQA